MDDGNGDQKNNDAQSEVKQNCLENTNSLTPSSDNCVAKKTSFEITSITEPNNDDNDEDSPDTDSHIHDHRTENRHESDLQNYAENMVVYNSSNELGSSAPVIPTSSQYGLAIVENSDNGQSLGSIKNEDIHGVDASSQKNECDLNGLQNKNRNERFKVVKIESTEPFKRGRWVCMDFLDHSMNQQQSGNNKLIMVNGDNKAFSQANDLDSTEPLDNGHIECSEFKVSTNNVSTYTTNCNTTDNYKNQTSAYNIVSSGVTTPIHSACVSPGQSLQTNMQVPVLTSQPIATSVQAPQPQSLTQVQLPTQHNVNQTCIPHSSLQSHQIQQVIANAGVMQPQLQQTQPVINVIQNQNQSLQTQSIQHINSVDQHVTQTMPQFQQPMSQANLQQQIMQQHNMPTQFQKPFVSQNQSVLPNCAPLQPSVNQIINQQVPQYYNSPPIQSQNVSSEPSTTVPMSNQHISQPYQSIPIQNQPLQSHVQLQQNQQQLPPVQQMQQPSPQQNMVQQNQMQPQMVQQMSHQPSISQPSQPQQTQTVPQQTQQMSQQHIQQTQQTPQSQQTHVQQVTSTQQQGSQQIQQVSQQIQTPQGSQIQQQLPQQTHHIAQISQMTNQSQQMSQSNQIQQQIAQTNQQIPQQPQQIPQQPQQIPQQPQQIPLQNQQIPQQAQLQHPKQMQTSQIQSQPQQINQQQIGQIAGQNQMIHQSNQQINHTGQMISQQTHNQGQQLNQQNQVQQQQQPQQQIQQQLTQTSQSNQPIAQQILQPNQSMSQQSQVLPQQLGLSQSNSQMSVPQSQNQQVIQPQQPQHMQQPSQQYQQPQQMMQSQPQQLPMQTNQPIMHQPTYSQAQSLSAMQLQQAVMQIPTNTVTSTQMHIQQQQPVVQSNMMQQPQINVMSQSNIQPTIPPMSQQQMTYSLQQHVPINQNYANMQNCYIPSQQQNMATYKPSMKTVETVNKKKEDTNSEDVDNGTTNSGTTTVAIDNKIEQAMDLVKSHLMYAVREEVEVLKEKISELMDKVGLLETENSNLRMLVPPEVLEQYNREKQKPTNSQSTHNQ